MAKYSVLVLLVSGFSILISGSAWGQSDPLSGFLGNFKAVCSGTGPGKTSGQWNWILSTEHADEDDTPDSQSISVYESTPNLESHIWLVTFMNPNQEGVEKVEEQVNVTRFQSVLTSSSLRQTLRGSIDSFEYSDPTRKSATYQAHWKASMELDAITGTFQLEYKGYDPKDDPDYSFTCQLTRGA